MRNNKEIRRKILEILYKVRRENVHDIVHRGDLLRELNVPENLLDFNVFYLRDAVENGV